MCCDNCHLLLDNVHIWDEGANAKGGHCCQMAENSAKKLKYSGRKKLFTERNWSGILAEIAEK
jgi:hypothetical protein